MKNILPVCATLAMVLGTLSLSAAGQTPPAARPPQRTSSMSP